jgi:CubicO group peptidase (beta-lactamase class C family)
LRVIICPPYGYRCHTASSLRASVLNFLAAASMAAVASGASIMPSHWRLAASSQGDDGRFGAVVDNVHDGEIGKRPTGNRSQAAVHRLRKAADAGDERAQMLHADVGSSSQGDGSLGMTSSC